MHVIMRIIQKTNVITNFNTFYNIRPLRWASSLLIIWPRRIITCNVMWFDDLLWLVNIEYIHHAKIKVHSKRAYFCQPKLHLFYDGLFFICIDFRKNWRCLSVCAWSITLFWRLKLATYCSWYKANTSCFIFGIYH